MPQNAAEPQNDRELLLKLNGEIENLARSINDFSMILKDIEEKKISALDRRIEIIEAWKNQISGGWKLATVIWVLLTSGIVALIKLLFG
jgi:hypothetical protein